MSADQQMYVTPENEDGSFSSDGSEGIDKEDISPVIDIDYPVGEEVEVPGTNGQLFKTVITEGNGPRPPHGAKAIVHYTGTLASNGDKFDSSRDRNDPFEFTLGQGQVIKGWDQGVATMKMGERATLRCLPDYAYGAAGSPPKIPANSTLNFDVQLLDWSKSEDVSKAKNRSAMKGTRVEGKGWQKPGYESSVTMDVAIVAVGASGEDAAVSVEKKDWQLVLGEEPGFPAILEEALESFKKGEVAAVDVKGFAVTADYAPLGVVAGTGFRAVITLHDFTTVTVYSYKGADKLAQAEARKAKGNEFFKAAQWQLAVRKYKRVLEFVESDFGFDTDEQKAAAKALRIPARNNAAQAYINSGDYAAAVEQCTELLKDDASNVKALFRRGKAYNAQEEWDLAKADLKRAFELDPSNADAAAELQRVNAKIRAHNQREKAKFGNMFAKLAAMEDKEKPRDEDDVQDAAAETVPPVP